MAINFNLLSQGMDGPTPYQQDQDRNMQNQLRQQQLVQGQGQLEGLKASAAQTKLFRDKMVAAGKNPGDWPRVYEALNSTGRPEDAMNADKMLRAHYGDYQLSQALKSEYSKPIREWFSSTRDEANNPQDNLGGHTPEAMGGGRPPEGAAQPSPVANVELGAAQPSPGANVELGAVPSGEMNINALSQPVEPVNSLPAVNVTGKRRMSDEEQLFALGSIDSPAAQRMATVVAQRNKPSVIGQLEREITNLRKDGATNADPEIRLRQALIDKEVYGGDKDLPGYMMATQDGSFTGNFMQYKEAMAKQNRQPVATPVVNLATIKDPNNPNKSIIVDARTGRTIGEPGVEQAKPSTVYQQQQLRGNRAADASKVTGARDIAADLENLTDELVGSPEKNVPPHPGLSGITGIQAVFPSMPGSDARKAKQKLATIQGKIMAFGRQLATQDGKLGNMAVQEWKFISDSVQAIDPAADNLDVQLRDVVRQTQQFVSRLGDAFGAEYDAPAAAPTRSNIRSQADAILGR